MAKAKDNTLPVKLFEEQKDRPAYLPSDDDKTKISFVNQRFQEMQQARTIIDRDWRVYQKMIDAIYSPYPDERSSSIVPLASAIIELYVAEANKIKTEYNFKAETEKDETSAKALEYVWKYLWRKNNIDKEFLKWEYIAAGFGTEVTYTGFEAYEKTQMDMTIDESTMEMKFTPKTFKHEEIIVKNLDIRNWYPDDQATDSIESANDAIYRSWISYEKFKCYDWSPVYKNIEFVKPKGYDNSYKPFITKEESIKQGDFVEVMHYWNVEKDMYVELANGVLVREHPMISTINGEKALPFAVRILGKRNYSLWGRGLCEALMMFNSEVNNLRELLMDGIRRSNTQILAIGNGITFNGRNFSYENEILAFDGDLDKNFQQISGNPPNQAIFGYLDRLYKDIAVYVGIDVQNIIWQPQETAYQSEVQREASQKRVNVWLTNRDIGRQRFANLFRDCIQKFFPRKDANGLYPQLQSEWEQLQGKSKSQSFKKKTGKYMFECTDELLRGENYVEAYTNTTATTINAVDRQQKLESAGAMGNIVQQYAMAKQAGFDLDSIVPLKELLTDIAEDSNIDVQDSTDMQAGKDMLAQFQDKLKSMQASAQWVSPQPTPSAPWTPATPQAPSPPAQWTWVQSPNAVSLPTSPTWWPAAPQAPAL